MYIRVSIIIKDNINKDLKITQTPPFELPSNLDDLSISFDRQPAYLGDVEYFPSEARENSNKPILITDDQQTINPDNLSMTSSSHVVFVYLNQC